MATEACGNLSLCDRLGGDIEGSIHKTLVKYIKDQCPLVADEALLTRGAAREKGMRVTLQGEEEE